MIVCYKVVFTKEGPKVLEELLVGVNKTKKIMFAAMFPCLKFPTIWESNGMLFGRIGLKNFCPSATSSSVARLSDCRYVDKNMDTWIRSHGWADMMQDVKEIRIRGGWGDC